MHAHTAPPHRRGSSQPCLHCTKESCIFSKPVFHHTGQGDSAASSYFLFTSSAVSSLTLSFFFFSGLEEYLKYYRRKASLCTILICVTKVTLQGQGVSRFRWAKPLETLSFQLPICNSAIYRRTFTNSITVCLLQHCAHMSRGLCVLCACVGRGSEGLLWQHEVNQHSVHAAFHYKLSQTAEDYSLAQIYDVPRAYGEEKESPVVCSCMEWQWHSNSSHGRDYLTFLGSGGSNVTYFLKWSKNYRLIHQRRSAQSLAFWQF